jgi:hypothetical protein
VQGTVHAALWRSPDPAHPRLDRCELRTSGIGGPGHSMPGKFPQGRAGCWRRDGSWH